MRNFPLAQKQSNHKTIPVSLARSFDQKENGTILIHSEELFTKSICPVMNNKHFNHHISILYYDLSEITMCSYYKQLSDQYLKQTVDYTAKSFVFSCELH